MLLARCVAIELADGDGDSSGVDGDGDGDGEGEGDDGDGLGLACTHALLQSLAPAAGSPHVSHVDPALVQSEHALQESLLPSSKLQKASLAHGLLTEQASPGPPGRK